jgi:NDP-sugar pyrophosphorylase family protein
MQHYSVYGHHHFVLALGYMGSAIKKYIAELSQYEGNLRVDFTTREIYGQENPTAISTSRTRPGWST